MKALILNSGIGSRMGVLTSEHPKCMTEISTHETILSRQLKMITGAGIEEAVITTGYYDGVLVNYCQSLDLPIHYTFVKNSIYDQTNYIYSIYCARKYLDDDIILMHGDLVFENEVFERILSQKDSCMTVSSTLALPEKDFKAQVENGMVMKVGVDIFNEAMGAQALYKLNQRDWRIWLDKIVEFCKAGKNSHRFRQPYTDGGRYRMFGYGGGGLICRIEHGGEPYTIPCRRLWKLHCCRLEMLLFMTESSYGVCLGKNMSGQSKQVYLETKVQLTLPAN